MVISIRSLRKGLCVFALYGCSSTTEHQVGDPPAEVTSSSSSTSMSTSNATTNPAATTTAASTGAGTNSTSSATITSTSAGPVTTSAAASTSSSASGSSSASVSSGAGGAASGTAATGVGGGGTGNDSDALGNATQTGEGRTTERYETAEVARNDDPYIFITNGWGPGFDAHTISWKGTSFVVESLTGSAGTGGQPAGYPTVFCGKYSVTQVPQCGLPAARDSITSLRTGWRWDPGGSEGGEYNAAYDIWVGTGNQLQGYLMVWLRDPPSYQPAGTKNQSHLGVSVANVEGVWDIWDGRVNNLPIINWVRAEGSDSHEIEFDVMDFVRDAEARGFTIPGNQINAVAVGFEIWEGPITALESQDFYVDVQ